MNSNTVVKIKRLFADIEVSPNVGLFWKSGYKIDIQPSSIILERKIICIGYKWEGADEKVNVLKWDHFQNDEEILREFSEIAEEADEIVGHFGDGYDWPFIRGRMIILGLPPISIDKTIDTNAWARRNFLFNSTKLDYLSRVFGFGGKLKTDYDLWKRVLLKNDRSALAYMAKYCGVDVLKLEKVFKRFQPWMRVKSHAGVFAGHDKWTCPLCGTENVHKNKTRVSAAGTVTHQFQCNVDKHYYAINQRSYELYIEAKARKPSRLQKVRGIAKKRNR